MTQNLLITFRATAFPQRDGSPSPERAHAAARAFVAEVTRTTPANCFPSNINELNDGALVVVYEPYPYVGELEALPMGGPDGDSTGVIMFSGHSTLRTEYASFYPAALGHAVHAVDVLAPRYIDEHGPKRR